jgi:hypothetical protein
MNQIPQLVKSIDIRWREINTGELLVNLKELRNGLLQLQMVQIEQICNELNEQSFDYLLTALIDHYASDIEILREVTWIALIYYSQREIHLDKLIHSGLLMRFEKLLATPDDHILEQVD